MVLLLTTSSPISHPLKPVVCLPFSKVLAWRTSWELDKPSATGDHRENFTEHKNLQDGENRISRGCEKRLCEVEEEEIRPLASKATGFWHLFRRNT